MRRRFAFAWFIVVLSVCTIAEAARPSGLIAETTAARHGLTRPWFAQARLDLGRARVEHATLYNGILYVQTNSAVLHAIDAETGATVWAKQVGRPNHPSLKPGVAGDLVSVVNGSRLYVCNRYNGDLLYETRIEGAPAAGPGMSDIRAYVPLINGIVLTYQLDPLTDPLKELGKVPRNLTEEQAAAIEADRRENLRLRQEFIPPLACQSIGRVLQPPVVTRETKEEEFIAWTTDRGHMNMAIIDRRRPERLAVRYRLEADSPIRVQPCYLPPQPNVTGSSGTLFAGSEDGIVYAVRERDGETLWRFSTGDPIVEPMVRIGKRLYVPTQFGGMYCLDTEMGRDIWWTPEISRFLAQSKDRVYGADRYGNIRVLNAETGSRTDTIRANGLPIKVVNDQTDRLYLISETGLVQCLREQGLDEPLQHPAYPGAPERPVEEAVAEQPPAGQQQPAQPADPFAGGAAQPAADPGDAGWDPFGGQQPAAPAGGGEDPFGGGGGGGDPFGGGGGGNAFGGGGADTAGGDEDQNPFGGGDAGGGGGDNDPFGFGGDAANPF